MAEDGGWSTDGTSHGGPTSAAGPCSDRDGYVPNPGTLDRALCLVRFLRAHCDWDARQTPRSLVRHLLEEALEVAESIRADRKDELKDELGDLLLNVAFQIVIAEERGSFDAEAVAAGLEAKMIRRHPHLFSGGAAPNWVELKRDELNHAPLAHMAEAVPAPDPSPLIGARILQERAASVGFDWKQPQAAIAKIREESLELEDALAGEAPVDVASEIGDLLFSVVNVARLCGVEPAAALATANRKFERRFRQMERMADSLQLSLADLELDRLDALWEEAKAGESGGKASHRQ